MSYILIILILYAFLYVQYFCYSSALLLLHSLAYPKFHFAASEPIRSCVWQIKCLNLVRHLANYWQHIVMESQETLSFENETLTANRCLLGEQYIFLKKIIKRYLKSYFVFNNAKTWIALMEQ